MKTRYKTLRLGGYGDPAMLPEDLVTDLADQYGKVLGYTHQWREGYAQWASRCCMASADSLADKAEANKAGWRTFRVTYADDLQPDEIWCPATPEGGSRVTCDHCGLCGGNKRQAKNIAVKAHGSRSKKLLKV
jgi:hypothetical protein